MTDAIVSEIHSRAEYRPSNESFSDMFSSIKEKIQSAFSRAQDANQAKALDQTTLQDPNEEPNDRPLIPASNAKGIEPFQIPYAFVKDLTRLTYTDFKAIKLYVPEGMVVGYQEHATLLSNSMTYLEEADKQFIDVFSKWLAQRVGDPSLLASTVPSITDKAARTDVLDQLESAYHNQFVSSGQRQYLADYMKVISKQNDWPAITNQLNALTERCSNKLHEQFMEKLNRIDGMFTTLEQRIQNKPDVYAISKETLVAMVECSYTAARIFEFYGLTRHRVDTYSTAVRTSLNKLDYILRQHG